MNITYKCRCMGAEATIAVRDRTQDEDVVEWMEGPVKAALGKDHFRRSPLCGATSTEYVKVEIDQGTGFIGKVTRQ